MHGLRLIFYQYRSGTVNSNTVNSKFHLIRSFFEIFARFLSFHVKNARYNINLYLQEFISAGSFVTWRFVEGFLFLYLLYQGTHRLVNDTGGSCKINNTLVFLNIYGI